MSEDRTTSTTLPEIQAMAPESHAPAGHGLLDAFAEIHRSTAEAHAAYQRSMAESHAAFLRASEETLAHLASYLTGSTPAPRALMSERAPLTARPARTLAAPAAQMPAPAPTARAASPMAPPAARMSAPAPARMSAPAPSAQHYAAAPATQSAPVARVSSPAASQSAPATQMVAPAAAPARDVDLKAALFEVVAEKTGYPAEMLKAEMELEADLGIDSIKRVEILSALKKRAPQMQSATPQETASLRSLGQIVAFMEKKSSQSASRPAPQPSLS